MKRKISSLFILAITLLFCISTTYATPASKAVPLAVQSWKHMAKPVIKDKGLQSFVNHLYRPMASIGSGSTADAIRYELVTNESIKGKSHLRKGRESITHLQKWLTSNPYARPADRMAAEYLILDLQDALGEVSPTEERDDLKDSIRQFPNVDKTLLRTTKDPKEWCVIL